MNSSPTHGLSLEDLGEGIRNLTPTRGAAFCEAGAVCLDSQGHFSGVEIKIDGIYSERYELIYPSVTEQMRKSWRNENETTDNGACGIAILVIRSLTNMTIVEQSATSTGFDFWIGPDSADEELIFQDMVRLEVSGIRRGSDAQIKTRVDKKLKQIEPSDSWGLPAYVVVVEFSQPLSRVVRK